MSRAVVVMLLVIGVAGVAGCLQPDLVNCGDKSCPTGDVCLAAVSRCVQPDQLAACAGVEPDAPCLANGITGRCTDGACTPASCGNGSIEPGEVCDDGNQISGDGCNGTCSSDETCGNAMVDTVAGEGCDCGTAGAQSALCMHPNSDDPAAECDLQCRPRFCGDGFVSAIEQCDGSVPADATCDKFGYYTGAVSCVSCQLSTTTCSGRCGDGVVDPTHGEYCDGALPAEASCIDFGYDLGALGCGSACGPALASCRSLSWERIHQVHARAAGTWGGHGRVGIIYQSGDAWVVMANTLSPLPQPIVPSAQFPTGIYERISGDADEVIAAGPTTIVRWDSSNGMFTSEAPPWAVTAHVVDLVATQDGEFVSLDSFAVWQKKAGAAWQTIASPCQAGVQALFQQIDTMAIVRCDGDTVAYVWTGTGWREFAAGQAIWTLVVDGTGRFWATNGQFYGTIYRQSGTDGAGDPKFEQIPGSVTQIAAGATGVFLSYTVLDTTSDSYQFFGDRAYSTTLPEGVHQLVGNQTDTPIVAFDSGLYAIDRGLWLASSLSGQHAGFHIDGGPPTTADFQGRLYYTDDFTNPVMVTTPAPCEWGAVSGAGKAYCVVADGLYDGDTKVNVNGVNWFIVAADESFAALIGSGTFMVRDANGWTTAATNKPFAALAGDAANDLWLVTDDGATKNILHWDGTKLSQIATTTEVTIAVTPTTVSWLEASSVVLYGRTTNQTSTVAAPIGLARLAPGNGNELWGVTDGFSPEASPLFRFDGTRWTPVNVPDSVNTVVGLDSFGGDALITAPGGLAGTPTFQLRRTAAW